MDNTEIKKPTVKLVGQDGNVFSLLAICTKALKRAGQHEQAKELTEKVFSAGAYHEALAIMMDYCNVE